MCRMLCPPPVCSGTKECAMRVGTCCNYNCVDPTRLAPKTELSTCTLEDGSSVPSGWEGFGRGSNYCNRCICQDQGLVCTEMFCMDRSAVAAPGTPKLTTWTMQGAWDIVGVQEYLNDFEEIFADTLRVDKSAVKGLSVAPAGTGAKLTLHAMLNPVQAKFVETPEFESMLRSNIESTADDLAKAMGYDTRAGSFILQGPWDIMAVQANSLELQSNFAQALGIPPQFVDVEITEDDFLVKIDFTAKSEGAKLATFE
eukprot:TRINITY_DN81_c0_g1_i5.p1 TRINITY_DN81_c0_g1~~TRINITY_DN81_c0_g1_i5.p1  ORF type:complete len:256 (+),score=35.02 TRINITY_DN81_c0_g1_i5:381-1148(+)